MVRPQPGKLKNSIISGGASPSTPQVVSLFCAEIPTNVVSPCCALASVVSWLRHWFYMRYNKQNGQKSVSHPPFTAEQRAATGRYASEHGDAAAMKKFKVEFEGGQLGESTVCLFKKCYMGELKAWHSWATVPEGKSIASRKWGRPTTLGDLDTKVQAWIKALRKAGTPMNVNNVLATAEGVVTAVDRTLLKKNGGTIELKCSWAQSLMRK